LPITAGPGAKCYQENQVVPTNKIYLLGNFETFDNEVSSKYIQDCVYYGFLTVK